MISAADGPSHVFAEVPEAAAGGDLAALYTDIRQVLGTSTVALVYRALAVTPGRLAHVWESLRPNLGSADVWTVAQGLAAPEIGDVQPVPLRVLQDAGLDPEAAAATIADFRHGNCLNFLGLLSLLHGADGGRAVTPARAQRRPPRRVLPMADMSALPAGTVRILERMSAPIAGDEKPVLIPSLFRCFAHDVRLLEHVWRSIGPTARSPVFSSAVDFVAGQASTAALALPCCVTPMADADTRAIVRRFGRTIPGMIVAGTLLERSLSELFPSE